MPDNNAQHRAEPLGAMIARDIEASLVAVTHKSSRTASAVVNIEHPPVVIDGRGSVASETEAAVLIARASS